MEHKLIRIVATQFDFFQVFELYIDHLHLNPNLLFIPINGIFQEYIAINRDIIVTK